MPGSCLNAGIVGCKGDGVHPVIHETGLTALTLFQGQSIPFIKPWEGKELEDKLEKARNTGCKAPSMDLDAAGLMDANRNTAIM